MSTIADLTSAISAHSTALDGLSKAVSDLEAVVAQLRNSTTSTLSPADQAALDTAVSTLSAATAQVSGEAQAAEAAANPSAASASASSATSASSGGGQA